MQKFSRAGAADRLLKILFFTILLVSFCLAKGYVILDTGRKITSEKIEQSVNYVVLSGFLGSEVFDTNRILFVSMSAQRDEAMDWNVQYVLDFRKGVYAWGRFDAGIVSVGSRASFLRESARQEFLDEFVRHRILLTCLNIVVPSLGSWLVGDWESGILTLSGFAASGLIALGAYHVAAPVFSSISYGVFAALTVAVIIGAIGFIGVELFNLFNTFGYSIKQINKLRKVLDQNPYKVSLSPLGFRMTF